MLYTFKGQADGARPGDPPVLDAEGNLFGTTFTAGDLPYGRGDAAEAGGGVVWELSPPATQGGAWAYQVLHTFTGYVPGGNGNSDDGARPSGMLTRSISGALYGTTDNGGDAPRRLGVAYSLAPPSVEGGSWNETILHNFTGAADGWGGGSLLLTGHGTLLLGLAGTHYDHDCEYCDVLFDIRLDTQPSVEGRRTFTELSLASGRPVLYGDHNVVYGADFVAGSVTGGDIVELSPPAGQSGGWTQKILHAFSNSGQGHTPNGTLLALASGTLFGTTQSSGDGGGTVDGSSGYGGAVFRLDPPVGDSTTWVYTELHQFSGSPGVDGGRPDGADPNGALVFGRHHQLYGSTTSGGRHNMGTIFVQIWL